MFAFFFIQVLFFKVSKGKRIFKMAPIHHHFELLGWNEKKVVLVFSLVSLLLSAFAVGLYALFNRGLL